MYELLKLHVNDGAYNDFIFIYTLWVRFLWFVPPFAVLGLCFSAFPCKTIRRSLVMHGFPRITVRCVLVPQHVEEKRLLLRCQSAVKSKRFQVDSTNHVIKMMKRLYTSMTLVTLFSFGFNCELLISFQHKLHSFGSVLVRSVYFLCILLGFQAKLEVYCYCSDYYPPPRSGRGI